GIDDEQGGRTGAKVPPLARLSPPGGTGRTAVPARNREYHAKGPLYMSKAKRRWALAALVLAAPACPALQRRLHAAAAKKPSNPHVVLIGISDYADKQIKPRPHAEDDIKALYDLFTNKDFLGAKPENVRLLLGKKDEKRPSKPATRANIL